jgi:predicted lipid-binding transport protein (Tim44 family)
VPNCPKCGAEVNEDMSFCPKCGASLRIGQTPSAAALPRAHARDEKAEKQEKEEKTEKTEKHEKGEYGLIGPLIGGLILIFLGIMAFLQLSGLLRGQAAGATFLLVIGTIIIVVAIYGAATATRRHPRT